MIRIGLIVMAALLAPSMARAACTGIAGTALAFGTYTGAATVKSTSTVTLSGCTTNFNYSVGMNGGSNGGTVTARWLNAAKTFGYHLFQDAAGATNWGTTGSNPEGGKTTGATAPLTVYGQIYGGQYPPPGTYTDTITASQLNTTVINGTFTVSVTVPATCTISATNLAFGNYFPSADSYATSTITLLCTQTTPYTVGLGYGLQPAGGTARELAAGPALLGYGLFQDAAHTVQWGTAASGASSTVAGTGNGLSQTLTVYGDLYKGQFGNPGVYTDTVVATVTY